MDHLTNRRGETIGELCNKEITESVKISNCTDCTIENCDISGDDGQHLFVLWNCQNCTVINSHFHDRKKGETTVKIDGDCNPDKPETYPMNNTFEGCEWYELYNREPLRIGDSRTSHLPYNTTISGCTLRDLQADKETISIKSCGNTVIGCNQINCESSFVIRHGYSNTLQDNTFIGDQSGNRVYGKYNNVIGNTFTENKSEHLPPLLIVNGNVLDEPYEGSPGSGNEGHTAQSQVRNAEVSGNRFENCVKCVVWGRDSSPYKPDYVRFVDNEIIADMVPSIAIEFIKAEPFLDGDGKLFNDFASNMVVGNAYIDNRIAFGFK